jgi:hypothetical protein
VKEVAEAEDTPKIWEICKQAKEVHAFIKSLES